ncbi:MAG: lytic transglycosylase domain-containing protein [Pseudomonadota bacterium]
MHGRALTYWILACFLILGPGFTESTVEAKFLKNGVRAGDRSGLNIVRRPGKNTRKRILAPGERQRLRQQRQQSGKKTRKGGRYKQQYSWFWKEHSPLLASASAGRWAQSLKSMQDRRSVGKGLVGEDRASSILTTYRAEITAAARKHNVSEALLAAVITVESLGKPKAVSHKGAQGLMQLIPATAKRFGVANAFDPAQNITGGATYLSWLLNEFRGDALLALAGYNAGEGAVRKNKGVPPYAETRDYVVKVMDAMAALQSICPESAKGPRERCGKPPGST